MSSHIDDLIRKHWTSQAEIHGAATTCGMEDEIIRAKELEAISTFVALQLAETRRAHKVLDLGCGNGFTLEQLSKAHPRHGFWGIDYSLELLSIARRRIDCDVARADARALPFPRAFFDIIYSERCLINIPDSPGQEVALEEIARVLAPGGHYLMIEAFTDGHANYNKARRECGLPEVDVAFHNKYIEKDLFLAAANRHFTVVPETGPLQRNFLSSHYFISRVLYPLTTKADFVRNSEFVKFFSGLAPMGNYSPIQAVILQRRE